MKRPVGRAAFALFLCLIVWAPIPLGSNRPWAWALLEIGIFASGLLWLAAHLRREAGITSAARAAWPALLLFAAWLLWTGLQWLPLPIGAVQVLSPNAAALHALGGGSSEHFATLSIEPHATRVFWLKSCAWALTGFSGCCSRSMPRAMLSSTRLAVPSGLSTTACCAAIFFFKSSSSEQAMCHWCGWFIQDFNINY